MFKERDLVILGAGGLLAVFALFLPFSFGGKIAAGITVLIVFMMLALLRLGPDRVPPEQYLLRRIRFALQPRKHVYHQEHLPARPEPAIETPAPPARTARSSREDDAVETLPRPVSLAFDEVGIYPLASVFLAVVGAYFVAWLAQGGEDEIARLLSIFSSVVR